MKHTTIALLSMALALQASADVQLLPAGEFVGRDGRPGKGLTWKLSDTQGQQLAQRLSAKHATVRFNFDYEHQAMLSEKNGQPAPASGWSTVFEWRNGQGLYALNVQWTAKARQMIDAHEYLYISPVIAYDSETGQVTGVINAALTNIPNLDMTPVAQAVAKLNADFFHHQPEQSMNALLKALLASLNLTAEAANTMTEAEANAAVAKLKAAPAAVPGTVAKALGLADTATEAEAVTAAAALKAQADTATGLSTQMAALKAAGNPDPAKWVALDKFNELNTQVATLSAQSHERQVEDLLSAARAEGKCSPVVEGVWRDVGKKDIAQLKSLIAATPANPALAGKTQSTSAKHEQRDPNAAATADELAMCKSLGLTLEQFRSGAEASH